MTKRGGNTGLPQKSPGKAPEEPIKAGQKAPPRLIKEYRSKTEREAVVQRSILLGVVSLIALAVVILAIAFITDGLIRPRQAVAQVNGTTLTIADFERRVSLERALLNDRINDRILRLQAFGATSDQINQDLSESPPYSTWLNEIQIADQLGNRVLNDMIDEELVRQEAATRSITVDDAQVEEQVQNLLGYDPEEGLVTPTATPEPSITPTPFVSPTPTLTPTQTLVPTETPTQEFTSTPTITPVASSTPEPTLDATQRAQEFTDNRGNYYSRLRTQAGVSDADIRRFFETQALREALRDTVTAEMGNTAPFVNTRHILVESEAEALEIKASLDAGESFADLARVTSTDTGSGANGGELGWGPASQFATEFADAVRTAEIGAIVGPVQTEFGYHIIQVRAREDRELSETEAADAREREFATYLEGVREAETNTIEIFDTWTSNVPDTPRFQPVPF